MIDTTKYTRIVQLQETTDGGYCYIAYYYELPTCISQGETMEEAQDNLEEAVQMVIDHLAANNLPIPQPRFPGRAMKTIVQTVGNSDVNVWNMPSASLVLSPA